MSIESDAFQEWLKQRATSTLVQHRRISPCCNAPSVEIVALEHPVGPTGIFKCLVCDAVWDPTWRQDDDDA
jgi:hypothetical protein